MTTWQQTDQKVLIKLYPAQEATNIMTGSSLNPITTACLTSQHMFSKFSRWIILYFSKVPFYNHFFYLSLHDFCLKDICYSFQLFHSYALYPGLPDVLQFWQHPACLSVTLLINCNLENGMYIQHQTIFWLSDITHVQAGKLDASVE